MARRLVGLGVVAGLTVGVMAPLWGLAATILALAAALFALGALLWATGDRQLDEVGRSLMLGVLLAVAVGVPQYMLDRRQKDRDFVLSLTLQQDLTGADLHDKDLSEVRLQGKRLAQADLREASLVRARLVHTDLRGADLRDADLRDADLRGARLDGASLDGADLTGARLKDANLTQASLPNAVLRSAQLQNASLAGACLAGAQLQDADLGGVDLAGAVFTRADVEGARFESDLRPATGLDEAGLAYLSNATAAEWPREFDHATAVAGRPAAPETPPRPARGHRLTATVSEVSDGDTVELAGEAAGAPLPNGGRAALIGINAPDADDTDGPAAAGFLRRILARERLDVQIAGERTDSGGRLLVYVWLPDGRMLNETMLEAGHATYRDDDGDAELEARLRAAETRAKQRGVGLWDDCPTPEERIAPEGVEIRTT
ncbi:MAG: pentapeptide repeat-containing protein [Thermoleophilaceae bacterium]